MRTFKIEKDYNDLGCNIYRKSTITINPGVTILVGCNGIGKTTLIRQMKTQLKKKNIPAISFDNLTEGGTGARSKALFMGDLDFAATSLCASEGENIQMNIGVFAREIGRFQTQNTAAEELWIFLDAIDSGLSVDNVIDLKDLFSLILDNAGNTEIYIVASANEYELARNESCYDVLQCRYVSFNSYEEYRSFILKTRAAKDKRVYSDRFSGRSAKHT